MNETNVLGCGCAACQAAGMSRQGAQAIGTEAQEFISQQSATKLLSGNQWPVNTGGVTNLTYQYLNALPSYYTAQDVEASNFEAFNTQMRNAAERIFTQIESFANINFVELPTTFVPQLSQITLGMTTLPVGTGAWAYFPDQIDFKGGDVWINNLYADSKNPVEGNYGFYVMMHEIGHTLGLQHAQDVLPADEASSRSTIMGYDWSPGYSTTYQLYDIAAIQSIFGANMNHNTGNNTYVLRPNELYTIWDAGGNDTFSAASSSSGVILNLNAGTFSTVGLLPQNIAIAYNVVIENATGGSGNDYITGNGVSNILKGGSGNDTFYGSAGNDRIEGESGTDIVRYNYDLSRFIVNSINSNTVTLQDTLNILGTDTLISIERFIFKSTEYSFAQLFANKVPVITTSDIEIGSGKTILASSIMSASDEDGGTLTYTLWDSYGATTSAFFRLDGVQLAAGKNLILSQAEFDRLEIVGGSGNFLDKLWVQVSDGLASTAWFVSNVTTSTAIAGGGDDDDGGLGGGGIGAPVAPVVSISDDTLNTGEVVLASTVMSVTDANGDALTYTLWDSYGAGSSAFFRLDGVQLAAGKNLILSQAEFDRLEIVGGSGAFTDKLWVQVSDGTFETSWFLSNITTSAVGGAGEGAGDDDDEGDSDSGGGTPVAPVVSISDDTLNTGEVVLASTVMSVTDANGDALTYTLWDSYGAGSSAFFRLDGVQLAAGKNLILSQAEFDRLEIVGGAGNFADKLWIQVSDGTFETSWFVSNITTTSSGVVGDDDVSGGGTNSAPVVTTSDTTLARSAVIDATTVMSASDADGDALTYTLWDSYGAAASAFFRLDGTQLAAGKNLILSQAEFDRLEIVGGAGNFADKLWIQVSDGEVTTSWFVSNVTTSAAVGIAAQDITLYEEDDIEQALSALASEEATNTMDDSGGIEADNVIFTDEISDLQETIDGFLYETTGQVVEQVNQESASAGTTILNGATNIQNDILFDIESVF